MKKTILFLAAIFIASQLFSQDVEKITINFNQTQNYQSAGLISFNILLRQQGLPVSSNIEQCTKIYDIKNMKSIFKSNFQKEIVRDIVKFEKLEDGTFHIVVDELNILYPEEDNVRILTHQYVNPSKNLSVYNFYWEEFLGYSVAIKELHPQITLN